MVVLRTSVVPHGLIDEVVDRAIEVVGHLLERLPEDVPAVEMAHRLLALIHRGRSRLLRLYLCFTSFLQLIGGGLGNNLRIASAPATQHRTRANDVLQGRGAF